MIPLSQINLNLNTVETLIKITGGVQGELMNWLTFYIVGMIITTAYRASNFTVNTTDSTSKIVWGVVKHIYLTAFIWPAYLVYTIAKISVSRP